MDPLLKEVDAQIQLLSNELYSLREQEIRLSADESHARSQVEELSGLLSATKNSVQSLWSKLESVEAPMEMAGISGLRGNSDKRELALAGEDNVRRQVELLAESNTRLSRLESKLSALKNQIAEKQGLLTILNVLREDRKTLNNSENLRERVEKARAWGKSAKGFFDELEKSSITSLASQKDIQNQIKKSRNGTEPGLEDFIRLSNQRIESVLFRAENDLNSREDGTLADSGIREVVISGLRENAKMRLELNRVAGLALIHEDL